MVRDYYTDVSFRCCIVAFMFTADCGSTLSLLFLSLNPIFFHLSADELLFLWVNPILIVQIQLLTSLLYRSKQSKNNTATKKLMG